MSWQFNPFTGQLDRVKGDSSGGGTVVSKIANEAISALKLVVAVDSEKVEIAEPDTHDEARVLGLSTTSGSLNDTISVLTFGQIDDVFFNFPINDQLFLGSNGTVTNVPVSTGEILVPIGHSLGAGAIFIDIEKPTELK